MAGPREFETAGPGVLSASHRHTLHGPSPIVRDFAFPRPKSEQLPSPRAIGDRFSVRSSAYAASPIGYEDGHPVSAWDFLVLEAARGTC